MSKVIIKPVPNKQREWEKSSHKLIHQKTMESFLWIFQTLTIFIQIFLLDLQFKALMQNMKVEQ